MQIADVGGLALAAALKSATALQRLNLNYNDFTTQTYKAIANGVEHMAGEC
jgi:hypothetical protein